MALTCARTSTSTLRQLYTIFSLAFLPVTYRVSDLCSRHLSTILTCYSTSQSMSLFLKPREKVMSVSIPSPSRAPSPDQTLIFVSSPPVTRTLCWKGMHSQRSEDAIKHRNGTSSSHSNARTIPTWPFDHCL